MSHTWFNAVIGGALIGAASGGLMLGLGRIAGVSGVFGGLIRPVPGESAWRIAFIAGMVFAGVLAMLSGNQVPPVALASPQPIWLVIGAGLLVGAGTTLANGCTSGHGVCGLALVSTRSLVAVATFLSTGFVMTYVVRHLLGSA